MESKCPVRDSKMIELLAGRGVASVCLDSTLDSLQGIFSARVIREALLQWASNEKLRITTASVINVTITNLGPVIVGFM